MEDPEVLYVHPFYDSMGRPQSTGMTLLDYFAGQALAALSDAPDIGPLAAKRDMRPAAFLAQVCYGFAEAMLAEREKRLAAAQKEEQAP